MNDYQRWQGGKSHHKYSYTISDIARITGRAEGTVRNDSCGRRVDLDDLESVVEYISKRRSK